MRLFHESIAHKDWQASNDQWFRTYIHCSTWQVTRSRSNTTKLTSIHVNKLQQWVLATWDSRTLLTTPQSRQWQHAKAVVIPSFPKVGAKIPSYGSCHVAEKGTTEFREYGFQLVFNSKYTNRLINFSSTCRDFPLNLVKGRLVTWFLQSGMDYLLMSDSHPLLTSLNAVWKLFFSNIPSTPLPCCPPSDCQRLWFSIITELACVINACIIIII